MSEPLFTLKNILRGLCSTLALLGTLVVGAPPSSLTVLAQDATNTGRIRCSDYEPLYLNIPPTFERVTIQQSALRCAFRSKNRGFFRTLNVVVEPRSEGSRKPTIEERTEAIRSSYSAVGLTDTTLSSPSEGSINGYATFTVFASYRNKGLPMVSIIMVLDLPDRTYTVSALDTAEAFESHKFDLQRILESIEIPGDVERGMPYPTHNRAIPIIAAVVLVAFICALFLVLKRKKGR